MASPGFQPLLLQRFGLAPAHGPLESAAESVGPLALRAVPRHGLLSAGCWPGDSRHACTVPRPIRLTPLARARRQRPPAPPGPLKGTASLWPDGRLPGSLLAPHDTCLVCDAQPPTHPAPLPCSNGRLLP